MEEKSLPVVGTAGIDLSILPAQHTAERLRRYAILRQVIHVQQEGCRPQLISVADIRDNDYWREKGLPVVGDYRNRLINSARLPESTYQFCALNNLHTGCGATQFCDRSSTFSSKFVVHS
jgi:hypothetical protein